MSNDLQEIEFSVSVTVVVGCDVQLCQSAQRYGLLVWKLGKTD